MSKTLKSCTVTAKLVIPRTTLKRTLINKVASIDNSMEHNICYLVCKRILLSMAIRKSHESRAVLSLRCWVSNLVDMFCSQMSPAYSQWFPSHRRYDETRSKLAINLSTYQHHLFPKYLINLWKFCKLCNQFSATVLTCLNV